MVGFFIRPDEQSSSEHVSSKSHVRKHFIYLGVRNSVIWTLRIATVQFLFAY